MITNIRQLTELLRLQHDKSLIRAILRMIATEIPDNRKMQ